MKTRVLRISQVMGSILPEKDGDTFHIAQNAIQKWLHKKIGTAKFENGEDKSHFSHEDDKGQRAEHLTIDMGGRQKIWCMTYSHPCADISTRRWVTEAALAVKPNGSVLFGMKLNVLDTRLENIGTITYSVPNLLRELASELRLVSDERVIMPYAEHITDATETNSSHVDDLCDLILNPKRKLPVILISREANNKEYLPSDKLGRKLAGIAHVYTIDQMSSYVLRQRVGRELATYNGAIRLYMPMDNNLISNRHFYMPQGPLSKPPYLVERELCRLSFLKSLEHGADEDAFPSFSTIKNQYFENITKNLQISRVTETISDQRDAVIKAQTEQISALEAQLNEVFSLATEEETKRIFAEKETLDLRRLLEEANQKIADSPKMPALKNGALFPDLSMLQPWAEHHFPEELAITRRAQKSALKSVYAEPNLIFQGLTFLAREFRNSILYAEMNTHRDGLRNLQREAEAKLRELKLENRFSISRESAGLFGDDYYVTHLGNKLFLDRHLTKGNGRDPVRCLRIYYTYDEDDQKIVVGHLPSHLRNQLT
jgi:hypothetical protein